MTDAEESAIRDRCRQVLADYAIAVDEANAEGMIALFTEDGVLVRASDELRGPAALPRLFEGRAPGTVMRHLVTTQSIEVAADGRSARAHSYYVLYVAAGEKVPLPMPEPFSLGDWHSDLVLTASGWKLARQEVRRKFVRAAPR